MYIAGSRLTEMAGARTINLPNTVATIRAIVGAQDTSLLKIEGGAVTGVESGTRRSRSDGGLHITELIIMIFDITNDMT